MTTHSTTPPTRTWTLASARLIVWAFENEKIRWSEDERYQNLAAYNEARLFIRTCKEVTA